MILDESVAFVLLLALVHPPPTSVGSPDSKLVDPTVPIQRPTVLQPVKLLAEPHAFGRTSTGRWWYGSDKKWIPASSASPQLRDLAFALRRPDPTKEPSFCLESTQAAKNYAQSFCAGRGWHGTGSRGHPHCIGGADQGSHSVYRSRFLR